MKVHCGDDYIYTNVEIRGGYIISIYEEDGRDGGFLYKKGIFGDLQELLNHIAYDFGNYKYDCILFNAKKENLTSRKVAYSVINQRILTRIWDEINYHKQEIERLRGEIDEHPMP